MERPEKFFSLFARLGSLDGIGKRLEERLNVLELHRPLDMLFHLPSGLIRRVRVKSIGDAEAGGFITVDIVSVRHIPPRVASQPYRVIVRDSESEFSLVFFKPSKTFKAFLAANLPIGEQRVISGRVDIFDGILQMTHPDFILPLQRGAEIPQSQPIYPTTSGLGQKTITRALAQALSRVPPLDEWIDGGQMAKAGWPSWKDALFAAHAPQSEQDLAQGALARQRLAYDEFFAHQLILARSRMGKRKLPGRACVGTGALAKKSIATLPYAMTAAQKRAYEEIKADLASPNRMNRLLQGDVGAGKTVVAFLALLHVIEAGGQGALMAPSEILASQHMQVLLGLASKIGVRMQSLTGRDKGKARARKLAALAAGEIDILVGTHALFQEDVRFKDMRLAVIDEQHRFGVHQRLMLSEKGEGADILVMTATPIPRSLSIVHYGDMEVSILDEKPPGRKPIKTALISLERYGEVIARLKNFLAKGEQCYWVCPLVEESELLDLSAARSRFDDLCAHFGQEAVGLVHGQMSAAEKDTTMAAFRQGHVKILVATTAIEVGVDIPNASVMLVERAEHFGLSQLHQLRGRVGRGTKEASCLLLYRAPLGETARKRLTLMRQTENGFLIAEEDLRMRGAGDVLGTAQSGVPRFRIGNIESQTALLARAHTDARKLLEEDPELTSARGRAARDLLALMEQNRATELISA